MFVLEGLGQQTIEVKRQTETQNDAASVGQGSPQGVRAQLGRFQILSRLGRGAFGTVFKALDPVLGREVALKVPRAAALQSPDARARFLREPRAAAHLRHPNIVPIYDAGADGEDYYIASAFIEGQTLADWLQDRRPEFRRAAEIVRHLAEALDYAHRNGVVHRDVKPSNVMLDARGEPLLMDFGLARLESSEEKLTQDGTVMGTPAYMAPEQADGSLGEVGPASDQYSLGVVLYELLTGETPFSGPAAVLIYNALHESPKPPRSSNPAIPRDLETVSLKCLAKRPSDRYATCGELAEDLRRWLVGEPIRARNMGPVERLGRWCRRNPIISGLSATAALLLVLVAMVSTVAYVKTTHGLAVADGERKRAESERQRAEEQSALAHKEANRAEQQSALAQKEAKRAEERASYAEEQEKKAQDALARVQAEVSARKAAESQREAEVAKREQLARELDDNAAALQKAETTAKSEAAERERLVDASAWLTYTEHLKEADAACDAKQWKEAMASLDECPEQFRGWEWHCLKALADGVSPTADSVEVAGRIFAISSNASWAVIREGGGVTLYRFPDFTPLWKHELPPIVPWAQVDYRGALSPNGKTLCFLSRTPEGLVAQWIWDLDSNVVARTQRVLGWRSTDFSPDGRFLAKCYQAGIVLVDTATGEPVTGAFPRSLEDVQFSGPLAFAANGALAVVGSAPGDKLPLGNVGFTTGARRPLLFLWESPTQVRPLALSVPQACDYYYGRTVLTPDAGLIAYFYSDKDSITFILDVKKKTVISRLRGAPIAFAPDGTRIALLQGGSISLYEVTSARELPMLKTLDWMSWPVGVAGSSLRVDEVVAISPDWTRIVALSDLGKRIHFWGIDSPLDSEQHAKRHAKGRAARTAAQRAGSAPSQPGVPDSDRPAGASDVSEGAPAGTPPNSQPER